MKHVNTSQESPYTYKLRIEPLGDRAVTVSASNDTITSQGAAMAARLHELRPAWLIDTVPAYDRVTVFYDAVQVRREAMQKGRKGTPFELVCEALQALFTRTGREQSQEAARVIEVPVWYGGRYGPDLEEASERAGMDPERFVRMHQEAEHVVAMIGFMPGFPYLTGLPGELAQPRKSMPRASVPAGSVGIAGEHTGIYPLAVPGGWQIIGRTPLQLFEPGRAEPVLLRAGDRVRFVATAPPLPPAEGGDKA
ncbi:5-oxoprolinase subunit PxpB [Paenibacillus daejeonensis]|uniref:5-oxoprolinase subunit PxpB n=1 Tax=Paenibacillus daejeonensis TaxID=135193 RepID=UPI000376739D|nr:5-oxoprolinase subunit PxpB [Paenibacillus daejeonensis]